VVRPPVVADTVMKSERKTSMQTYKDILINVSIFVQKFR